MNVNGETPKFSLVIIYFIIQMIANHYQFINSWPISASKKMSSFFFEEPSSSRPGNHPPAPNGPRLKVRVEEEIVGEPINRWNLESFPEKIHQLSQGEPEESLDYTKLASYIETVYNKPLT